jgi:hypothetical protein
MFDRKSTYTLSRKSTKMRLQHQVTGGNTEYEYSRESSNSSFNSHFNFKFREKQEYEKLLDENEKK